MDNLPFSSLPISSEVLRALGDMGFEEPTPIQAQTIPYIIEGRDLLGQAQTGTGKTCAFGIPIIDATDKTARHIQTLILSPTRELAIQIAEELHEVSKYSEGIRVVAIYGGQPIDRQILALKKRPQIIVGTPGRVMDHMRRKTIRLDELDRMILDEADEMLNMGFQEDIDTILESIPANVQKVFFSATMPKPIMELTDKYLRDPIHVRIQAKELTIPLVEQFYIEVREASKLEVLSRLIDAGNVSRALIFCNTKKRVDDLAERLNTRGYSAQALHGDMKQSSRDRVMKLFRSRSCDLLVATDVAARGIDVDDIEVVFNYDLPSDDEYYVHRIGRTGRAGKTGKAYTFVVGREVMDLKNIQRAVKANIRAAAIPSASHIEESRVSMILEESGKILGNKDLSTYVSMIEEALDRVNETADGETFYTAADLAAALLFRANGHVAAEREKVEAVVPYEEYAVAKRNTRPTREKPTGVRERPARDKEAARKRGKSAEPGMQRLFLNVGANDRIRPAQIVQFLAQKGEIPGKIIGAITIFDEYTFADVPESVSEQVIKKAHMRKIGSTVVRIERASEKRGEEN